ncbi:MAG: hypothetical protein KF767_15630 [Bdellovibrionaceae bacterium]|nr:hypothetical protein [Pseudobdellovibrionaceae bacterium]
MFLTAVGLAMAMPYLQKLSTESGDRHLFAQANRVRVFANAHKAKHGEFPKTPESFKAVTLPEGDLENVILITERSEIPEVFHKDLFESWLPRFEKEEFQILFVSRSLSGERTSLWLVKSGATKPLKLLER